METVAAAWQTQTTPMLARFEQVTEQAMTTTMLGAMPSDTLLLSNGVAPPPGPPTYIVKPEDNLIEIARNQLGDATRWQSIWELNRADVPNPNEIVPGQVLKMPNGSTPAAPSAPATAPGQNPPRATIEAMLDQAADAHGIPRAILKGIAQRESSWRQFESDGSPVAGRNSSSTDWGILQINDLAHPDAFPRAKTDLAFNLDYGATYLASQFRRYGNWQDAVAAYNAGSVRRSGSGQYANQAYVSFVFDAARQYGGGAGFTAVA